MTAATASKITAYIEPTLPVDMARYLSLDDISGMQKVENYHLIKGNRKINGLCRFFNRAADAGTTMVMSATVTMAAKSALLAAGASVGLPATGSVIAAGVIVGLGRGIYKIHQGRVKDSAENRLVQGWFDRRTAKTLLLHATIGGVGGWAGNHFHDQIARVAEAGHKMAGLVVTQIAELAKPGTEQLKTYLVNAVFDRVLPDHAEAAIAALHTVAAAKLPSASDIHTILSGSPIDQTAIMPGGKPTVSMASLRPEVTSGAEPMIPAAAAPAPSVAVAKPAIIDAVFRPGMDQAPSVVPVSIPANDAVDIVPKNPVIPPAANDFPRSMPAYRPTLRDQVARLYTAGGPVKTHKLVAAALAGDPQQQKDLGYYLYNGRGGLAQNKTLARALFENAADAGNAQAKADLAFIAGDPHAAPAHATVKAAIHHVRAKVHTAVVSHAGHAAHVLKAALHADALHEKAGKALHAAFGSVSHGAPVGLNPIFDDHGKVEFECFDRCNGVKIGQKVLFTVPPLK